MHFPKFFLSASGLASGALRGFGSPSSCASFSPRALPGVSVSAATYYPENVPVRISTPYTSIDSSNLRAFCRLELVIVTNETAGSYANTEIWLPDAWNGRVLTIGNGGFAGGVDVLNLGHVALPQGFAGISTNTGHNATVLDGSWAGPGNDNALVDYGWRALHLSVLTGKEVIKQYYRRAPKPSYYMGCSTGALKEIELSPESFDGVIIGAPASRLSRLMAWVNYRLLAVLPETSPRFITADLWTNVIGPAVMKRCDALDGLADGIVSNPWACDFRPETLSCSPGQDTTTCLTAHQVAALRRLYADYYLGPGRTLVSRGYTLGGESMYFSALGNQPIEASADWYRYMVLNDTKWTNDDYNDTTYQIADAINPGQINAIDPNLLTFSSPPHNGRLMHYVGLMDQFIAPDNSADHFLHAHAYARGHSTHGAEDFYALYPIPGMAHWCGGHGASVMGALFQPPPPTYDAERNILAAMVRWVEEGVAPSTLVATKYVDDTNPGKGVAFTRPLCRFPWTPQFRGGNPNDARSFECV
ncbi:feruloyl esterase-like protein [Trametes maxima]|nr:feruloyl esterase-like protein [Trametes maxima]